MFRFVLNRFLVSLPVVFGVITITFFLLHLVPGDPVDIMLGEFASSQDKNALREQLGLNQPLHKQYLLYLKKLLHLDLGYSLTNKGSVSEEFFSRFPATVELTLASIFWAIVMGIPLGVMASTHYHKWPDRFISFVGLLGISVPGFFLGPLMILFFSVQLNWLPVSGREEWGSIILPSITLGISLSSIIIRMTRASMLEVSGEDYIRTARAKGLSNHTIYFKHALKNALMPIITIVGLQFGALLTGTVVTETIFDWPGIGTLFYQSIQQRNYPMVQGCVLFISIIYVFVNFLTDICYALANPRVRPS